MILLICLAVPLNILYDAFEKVGHLNLVKIYAVEVSFFYRKLKIRKSEMKPNSQFSVFFPVGLA